MITLGLSNVEDVTKWSDSDLSEVANAPHILYMQNGCIDGLKTYKMKRQQELASIELERRASLK